MRSGTIITVAAIAALMAGPASAWRGGGGFGGGFDRGGFGGGGFDRGGFDRGGFGGWHGEDDYRGASGWSRSAGGADWYHGSNGGAYRPPQMTDTGYKPAAAYTPGSVYHPPAAVVGQSAYHPAGAAVGGDAFHGPVTVAGYHYPAGVVGYPRGYYGYGYHPYSWYGAGGIIAATALVGVSAAVIASAYSPYPYGYALSPVPYDYGYAVPTNYVINCGGMYQPICATPTQMWSQSYANTEAAGNAVMTAALAVGD